MGGQARGSFTALSYFSVVLSFIFCGNILFSRNQIPICVYSAFGPTDTANSPLGYGTVDHDGRIPSFVDDKDEIAANQEAIPIRDPKQDNNRQILKKENVPLHATDLEKVHFGAEFMDWQKILRDVTDTTMENSIEAKSSFTKYFERVHEVANSGSHTRELLSPEQEHTF